MDFLTQHGFDGLDFDWEYPVTRQGRPEDYDNFPLLVQAVRDAFLESGHDDWLLTMAIPVNPEKLDEGYDLPSLASQLDWFNLMSYDIFGSWDDVAGSNTDMGYVRMTVDYIVQRGIQPSQMALGMATYGRSSVLTDATCNTAGCPINGPGLLGCSGEQGFSPYFELMETYVNTGNYDSVLLNEKTGSMEMIVQGNVFVSLDVQQSFMIKYDYLVSR